MTMCDIRDLMANSLIKSVKGWGIDETIVPTATIQQIAKLGDASTFLNALGHCSTEDIERLRELASFLQSDEAHRALSREGTSWRISGIIIAASEVLPKIATSLRIDASSGRVGRLLRAMPILAGSHLTPLGANLSRVLNVEPVPEDMMRAYAEYFCKRDDEVLAAIDQLIVNDRLLGPVVVELTGRMLHYFGFDRLNLDEVSRESVIDCLVLMIGSVLERVEDGMIRLKGETSGRS